MSQKTNLNVSPYFDDFDSNNQFYRVLFKPGFPVQSRELTTLQSILQNQIESFGSHFFKDGSVVIPGNISYNSNYYAVKLNPTHLGIDIGIYINELVGKKIKGQSSQLIAEVQNVILNSESITGNYTLYVKYLNSNSGFEISQFRNDETLIAEESFVYGNTTINSGETFATTISTNATSIGSAVSISKGVYFIRGHFINVDDDTLILDQYTNTPSYRIGLSIQESIEFASSENSDLFDNARGFANFSAPGADRLKISTFLSKKSLNDFDDKNFVEILRVTNGVVKKIQDSNTYSLIKEYIAKRTYEESGDYALDPFTVETVDSLNDRVSLNGLYFNNERTEQGNEPRENLLSLKVSPGKAYVKGFDIEKPQSTILDVEKPRDTASIVNASVPFEMGNLLLVNNVSGTPVIGIDNNYTVDLVNQRKSSTNSVGSGTTIGKARVYSFTTDNAGYATTSSQWKLYLFDVQTYTVLTLNQSVSTAQCPTSSYVKGLSSGASGYVVENPSGNNITLIQTSGTFLVNEQILINGTSLPRSVASIRAYNVEDIKSVYQNSDGIGAVGFSTDFVADAVLQRKVANNFNSSDILSISSTGTATCAGKNFLGIRSDSIIRYQRPGFSTETFNRVSSVSSDGLSITLSGVTTVSGVCDGAVGVSTNTTFTLGIANIRNQEKAYLYAKLNNKNILDVNLSSSQLLVNRQITSKSTSSIGGLTLSISDVGISSAYFEPFDSEKYSIHYQNGRIEPLTFDKFLLDSSATLITLSGLSTSQSNVVINTTVRKNSIKNKQKRYIRSQKLEVSRTSSGLSTSITGLTTSLYYGLRVEDQEISLNLPDVVNVLAVYESLNNATPILDSLTFGSGLNLNSNSILGEKIIGETSGAVGQIVTRSTSTKIEFVYLNSNKFLSGETVSFEESGIRGAITVIGKGNYIDRTRDFSLDKGQREQYYDYSRIVRNSGAKIPTRILLVIFNYYEVPSNDSGDVYTVKSYDSDRFKNDIPILGVGTDLVRSSDTLDFRPRVSQFSSTTSSPFAFSSRNFSSAGTNPSLVVAPNESSVVGYTYYLPRIDKLVLNKSGSFVVIKGTSSLTPREPSSAEDSMDIASIQMPAYLYSPNDVKISLINNKRYTMRDIGNIEKRLENVENISSLSLLELKTQSLQIQDADGISRFKSGFYVDNFKTNDFVDIQNQDSKCSIDKSSEELTVDYSTYSLKSEIGLSAGTNLDDADFSSNLNLLDSNIKKTGDLLTLNYNEIEWGNLNQQFATNEQTVNPYGIGSTNGFVRLRPSSDTWVRTLNPSSGVIIRSQGEWNDSFINNIVLSTNPSNKFRSRNVEFYATGLTPRTQYYPFFDGSSNIDFIPKLLQVTMTSSSFTVGETVDGFVNGVKVASFRLANSNHKLGTYNAAEFQYTQYPNNPYSSSLTSTLPDSYSNDTTVLNIDTYSLCDDASGRFFGYTPGGMFLVGRSSGAQATVNTIQTLITDSIGDLIGCFYIRNPLENPEPTVTFNTGTKTFKLSSSVSNSSSTNISFTQTSFYPTGVVNSSTYTQSFSIRRSTSSLPLGSQTTDPLTQTFRTDNDGGFVTSVDLFFSGKDANDKFYVEIRETDIGGSPLSNAIQDFARAEISPSGITTSSNGSTATHITFPSPVYLQPNKQYALTLISQSSSNYKVWIAQSGQPTVNTQALPNAEQVLYSNSYTGGNLYKSQNGSVWNANVNEDLKFKFYKANFTSSSGTAYFNSPKLSIGGTSYIDDANIPKLIANPIKILPRKLVVGITTTNTMGAILTPGRKVGEGSSYGYIEKVGGSIGGITTTSVGAGYSNGTFSNVTLYSISGSGSGGIATVTFTNNQLSSVSIANSGNGYSVGDVLGITTSNVTRGSGARISVSSNTNIDTLLLSNVQGEEFSLGQNLIYYVGVTTVSLASTTIRTYSYVPSYEYSGNVFEVTQYSHGMHSDSNKVVIKGVEPDTPSNLLTAAITANSTSIGVANTSNFTSYEGISVSAGNPGYVIINNEIIEYTAVGSQSLTISTRGVDGTLTRNHSVNDLVYKYEVGGVSLRRINSVFDMPSNSTLKSLREIDSYHLEFNRYGRASGSNQLSFSDQRDVGGTNCRATQNIQYSAILPQFNILTPESTSSSSLIRTVSGTSAGGNEASFVDLGYEPVALNELNYFNSPRIVCSRINETNNLSSNKSLTLGITLSSSNSNVSPAIDVSEAATFIFNRNRINRPISNFTSDSRSNELSNDPHSAIYISKRIDLVQPATSLKVILNAYRHSSSDFRVLYKLYKSDSSEIEQAYELFPGYSNLSDINGDGIGETVINTSLDDGSSDIFIRPSNDNEYLEYQYTANGLDPFNGFSIKIVMIGTNEAYSPKFKDLRAIALA